MLEMCEEEVAQLERVREVTADAYVPIVTSVPGPASLLPGHTVTLAQSPHTPHTALSLVMKRKHYTKLVTCVTVVTIVSMFSAMVTDLHQYWRRDNNQLVSVGSRGENSQ